MPGVTGTPPIKLTRLTAATNPRNVTFAGRQTMTDPALDPMNLRRPARPEDIPAWQHCHELYRDALQICIGEPTFTPEENRAVLFLEATPMADYYVLKAKLSDGTTAAVTLGSI